MMMMMLPKPFESYCSRQLTDISDHVTCPSDCLVLYRTITRFHQNDDNIVQETTQQSLGPRNVVWNIGELSRTITRFHQMMIMLSKSVGDYGCPKRRFWTAELYVDAIAVGNSPHLGQTCLFTNSLKSGTTNCGLNVWGFREKAGLCVPIGVSSDSCDAMIFCNKFARWLQKPWHVT